MTHLDWLLEQVGSILKNRRAQFSVACLIGVLIVWSYFRGQNLRHLSRLTPEESGRYFYKLHRGTKQKQVEGWLASNRLKIECEDLTRLHRGGKAIYVRVKTKPEAILQIEFDHGNFNGSFGYPYAGACPLVIESVW
jgi:hypothetical protein